MQIIRAPGPNSQIISQVQHCVLQPMPNFRFPKTPSPYINQDSSKISGRPQGPAQPVSVSASTSAGLTSKLVFQDEKYVCKTYLSNLLHSAGKLSKPAAKAVKELVQGLIDAQVDPDIFASKLQAEFKSLPQTAVVPFLKVSYFYLHIYHS